MRGVPQISSRVPEVSCWLATRKTGYYEGVGPGTITDMSDLIAVSIGIQ